MSKKDYCLIAKAISDANAQVLTHDDVFLSAINSVDRVINFLTEALQRDNPHFDSEKFRKACKA